MSMCDKHRPIMATSEKQLFRQTLDLLDKLQKALCRKMFGYNVQPK